MVLESLGQFQTVLDSFKQFWTVWDSLGQFWTVLDSFGLLDYQKSNGELLVNKQTWIAEVRK